MNVWWVIILVVVAMLILLWLVFGINWRSKYIYRHAHERMLQRLQAEYNQVLIDLLFSEAKIDEVDEYYRPLCHILMQGGRPSVSTTDQIEIITSGKRKYELIMHDISQAKESIHIEYFHFGIDKGSRAVRRLLMEKARQGVKVRFINENIANFPIPRLYFNLMRRAGVEVKHFTNNRFSLLRFLLTLSYRDHRKIIVIDGRIAYAGGMNINDHYFNQWRDTHFRLTGNSVSQLQLTFLDTWLKINGELREPLLDYFPMVKRNDLLPQGTILTQVTPDDPTSPSAVLLTAYEWIINHAKHYVWFQSPYLAPPQSLLNAMRNAVKRGVEVVVMVPERCDTKVMRPINRSFYRDFIDAGVVVLIRKGEFMHSKTIICDDYLSCIGTTNLDNRSFGIDYEIDTFFYDTKVAQQNKDIFNQDSKICSRLTHKDLEKQKRLDKIYCRLMRQLSPVV